MTNLSEEPGYPDRIYNAATVDAAPRPRVAHGPTRPVYFGNADLDRVFMVVLALATEVSALRERLATHERLGDETVPITTSSVEGFVPGDSDLASREVRERALIHRVMRVIFEEENPPNAATSTMPEEK